MNQRTGKECNKVDCISYHYYRHWARNLCNSAIKACMECKHAYNSQYRRKEENNATE